MKKKACNIRKEGRRRKQKRTRSGVREKSTKAVILRIAEAKAL